MTGVPTCALPIYSKKDEAEVGFLFASFLSKFLDQKVTAAPFKVERENLNKKLANKLTSALCKKVLTLIYYEYLHGLRNAVTYRATKL